MKSSREPQVDMLIFRDTGEMVRIFIYLTGKRTFIYLTNKRHLNQQKVPHRASQSPAR